MLRAHGKTLSAAVLVSTVSALALGVGQPAVAQSRITGPAIEEIIVTATKRAQTVFDAPVSVTAVDGESLEAANIRDVNELATLVPTLVVNSSLGPSQTVFTIRGIGTQSNNTGLEQSVGVFIDGVYRGRAGAATTDYVDISRIEVLRGPQGTLFGRNTSAGVISVHTAAPSFEAQGRGDLSIGNYGYRQFRGVISGPLMDDRLAASLAASVQTRDGFIEDVNTGTQFDDRGRYSVRGQLLWTPTDSVRVRTIVDWTDTDETCCIAVPLFYGPTAAALRALGGTVLPGTPGQVDVFAGTFPDTFARDVAVNPDSEQPTSSAYEDGGVSTEVTWDLDGVELTAIGAYRYFSTAPVQDSDLTDLDLFTSLNGQDIDEVSLDLRLASTGANRVDWLVGAFYFDQKILAEQYLDYGTDARRYLEAITPRVPNPLAPGTTISPITLLERLTGRPAGTFIRAGRAVTDTYDYSAVSYALYGNATWNISEDLSLSGGLRYSYEDKEADYNVQSVDALSQIRLVGPLAPFAGLRALQQFPAANPFTAGFDEGNLSGAVSIAYELSDRASVYARYANGYKSGGLNMNRTSPGTVPGNPVVDPRVVEFGAETVDSVEVGTKLRLFGRRLSINGSAFYQKLDEYQNNVFNGTTFTISNAGSVEGYGIETDWMLAVSDYLTLDGGLVLQDVDFDDYADAPPTAAQQALGLTRQDLSGRPVPRASDVTGTLAATVKLPVSEGIGAALRVDTRYRSAYYTNGSLESISRQDGYATVNASLSIGAADGAWALEVWGKNITDAEVINQSVGTLLQNGSFSAFLEPPPTWGMTAKFRF